MSLGSELGPFFVRYIHIDQFPGFVVMKIGARLKIINFDSLCMQKCPIKRKTLDVQKTGVHIAESVTGQ